MSDLEDQVLDESLKADLDKIRKYAGYIDGAESNVLRDYPDFEDDGDTYYQHEDQLFGITGHYKFEYFEGKISSVRFTWLPADWRKSSIQFAYSKLAIESIIQSHRSAIHQDGVFVCRATTDNPELPAPEPSRKPSENR